MTMLRTAHVCAFALVLIAGCGGSNKTDDTKPSLSSTDAGTAASGDKADEPKPPAKMPLDTAGLIKQAADDVCRCKDEACATKVAERMKNWLGTKMAKLKTSDEKLAYLKDLQQKHKDDLARGEACAYKLKGSGTTATAHGPLSPAVKKFGTFATAMCACKDIACTKKVEQDVLAWAKTLTQKATAADIKAMLPFQKRFANCHRKLTGKSSIKAPK